ncbi:hypothetical protein OZ410_06465 [Robiginitalea sp. M366]|uniref:hypothetical protein n=1 Tax=Robiginitalea aestuariiviva TaxID=3036903 RepID=UPI00240DCBA5|nr:hypothetical protein [Robiginitalea aestuariiviva]MDG1571953.1 hypothetical protein [Robiginitalea aestuariiviva]
MIDLYRNIDLFCPGTIEFIFDIIYQLGYTDEDLNSPSKETIVKKDVLKSIKDLMELNVLSVKSWYEKSEFSKENPEIDEIINRIDGIWFKGAKYPDFFNMVLFDVPDWYINTLKDLGMSDTTNWKNFVETHIGDLEQWIKKNKPRD